MTELINYSQILNIVLGLLLIFQWDRQHAKEQNVKNTLFSIRRMLSRMPESSNAMDALDATLATLDVRSPFTERLNEVVQIIKRQIKKEAKGEIERLPQESV